MVDGTMIIMNEVSYEISTSYNIPVDYIYIDRV